MRQIAFTDIDDIRVGHAHDLNAGTAIGTLNVFPFIGGIVFQLYAGMILDVSGSAPYPPAAYLPVLYFFLAALTISLLCTLFVRETFGR